MQILSRHINEFVELMMQKGYDSQFLCNTSHPGKLEESLQKHFLECLEGSDHVPPFYLTTYSNWKDDESPYVKCDFKVRYNNGDGLQVVKLHIDYANLYGSIRKKEVSIDHHHGIPNRTEANNMVMKPKELDFKPL